MKRTFTKKYILENAGCYSTEQTKELSFINNKPITIEDILKSEISLQDKGWWLIRKCKFTTDEKRLLALKLAEVVLPIYEEKYPDDKRVRGCIKAIKDFNKGKIDREQLRADAAAAYAAYAAADAAAYAAADAAADAAAYAAAAADAAAAAAAAAAAYADADAAAYAAADAAAYAYAYAAAAAAAAAEKYQKKILNAMLKFVK